MWQNWSSSDFFLILTRCPEFGDGGLRHVSSMRQLRRLWISHASISERGLRHLAPLVALRELQLCDAGNLSDSGVRHIARLSRVESLYLRADRIGDVGIEHIARMQNLRELWLEGVSAVDFTPLESLRSLRVLGLYNVLIGDDQLGRLRRLMPSCSIVSRSFAVP
ncbi:MAG: hypothetical protein ACKV0T_16655 [Planctomycetales bacterium]